MKLGIYKHCKGALYEVIAIARDSNDFKKEDVIYKSLTDSDFPAGTIWRRSKEEFVNNHRSGAKRFEYLKPSIQSSTINWIYDKPCPKDGEWYLRWYKEYKALLQIRYNENSGHWQSHSEMYYEYELSKAWAYTIEGPKE